MLCLIEWWWKRSTNGTAPLENDAVFVIMALVIDGSLPNHLLYRRTFNARGLLLLMWIVVSFVIVLCYSSILSSLLITPVYQDPIDNVQDMLNSASELVVPKGWCNCWNA